MLLKAASTVGLLMLAGVYWCFSPNPVKTDPRNMRINGVCEGMTREECLTLLGPPLREDAYGVHWPGKVTVDFEEDTACAIRGTQLFSGSQLILRKGEPLRRGIQRLGPVGHIFTNDDTAWFFEAFPAHVAVETRAFLGVPFVESVFILPLPGI